MQIWFIVSLLFSVIVAVFAVLNSSVVTINLVFQSFEMSQSIVILASAVAGAVIVLFLGLFSKVKTSLKIRELSNTLKATEKKNELLSNSIKDYDAKDSINKSLAERATQNQATENQATQNQATEIKAENQAKSDSKNDVYGL